jgi:hypothetical protein
VVFSNNIASITIVIIAASSSSSWRRLLVRFVVHRFASRRSILPRYLVVVVAAI